MIGWRGFAVCVVTLAVPSIAAAQLPSSYKTPGAAGKAKTEQVCAAGFEETVKPVDSWQRSAALQRYGLRPDGFEGDLEHLVPVSLGGTNDPDNLFPFRASGVFTVEAKATLAATMKDMVCAGKLSLKDAQSAFRKDWTKAYQQYVAKKALNAGGEQQ